MTPNIAEALSDASLELINRLPKAIGQCLNPIEWHRRFYSMRAFRPYDVGIAFDDAPLDFLLSWFKEAEFLVIILNSEKPEYWQLLREHRGRKLIMTSNRRCDEQLERDSTLASMFCENLATFYDRLVPELASLVGVSVDVFKGSLAKHESDLKRILESLDSHDSSDFRACHPNANTFCQLLAPLSRTVLSHKQTAHTERPIALVKSAERVLSTRQFVTGNPEHPERPQPNPPLILVWPYYDPNFKKLFREAETRASSDERQKIAALSKMYLLEQDRDTYDVMVDSSLVEDRDLFMSVVGGVQIALTRYLDNIALLHASFQDSPVIRLPLTGKTINDKLSRFHPSVARGSAYNQKAFKRLRQCGEALGERVPPAILEHIDACYDQLIAITDVPVEWTLSEGVPLAFLMDVCRLPQTHPNSLMSQYASNALLGYSIPDDIMRRTLVISGSEAGDPLGNTFQILLDDLKDGELKGVCAVRCSNKKDFVAVIEDIKPDFLIVDSHGDFKENSQGSFLNMGGERVLGPDIVQIRHAVPLVILSCCLTAPVYGCSNIIAQAFFESQSRAVLSTFLPISIDRGFMLYRRVLGNLETACSTAIHANWLSFISHVLRTSLFDDYSRLVAKRLRVAPELKLLRTHRAPWQLATMNPNKRRQAFHDIRDVVVKCFKAELQDDARRILDKEEVIPEALYYTNLGRSDLVQFTSWIKTSLRDNDEAKKMAEEILAQGSI